MNIINVVAAVIFQDHRILITKRKEGTHLGGYWEFPGGKVADGESETQALTRELAEELAIKPHIGVCLHRKTFAYSERTVNLAFYRCDLPPDAPPPRLLDAVALQWVSPTDLDDTMFPPANTELLSLLRDQP